MRDYLTERQLLTIASFKTAVLDIHCGPFGCGKTYALNIALGEACRTSKPPEDDSCIALIGKTAMTVKNNICNSLASMFGKNFRYDGRKKDGYTKDATLFGHRLRIIGLHDTGGERRIRGLNTYKVYGDEVSTWSQANFDLVQGRIRGQLPEGWEHGFIGSTNPDSPAHWLYKQIKESKDINYIKWSEFDTGWHGAKAYYEKLRKRYANSPAYLLRYVHGEFSAAEGLVYKEFNHKLHVLTPAEVAGERFVSYKIGVDFGTTNPTAILLIGVTNRGEYVVLKEKYIREATITTVRNQIMAMAVEYQRKLTNIYIDPSANALILELESKGMANIVGSNNDVENGIDSVKDMFTEGKLFVAEECENLLDELVTYAYSDKDNVTVVKKFDHACDALRYAIYTDKAA